MFSGRRACRIPPPPSRPDCCQLATKSRCPHTRTETQQVLHNRQVAINRKNEKLCEPHIHDASRTNWGDAAPATCRGVSGAVPHFANVWSQCVHAGMLAMFAGYVEPARRGGFVAWGDSRSPMDRTRRSAGRGSARFGCPPAPPLTCTSTDARWKTPTTVATSRPPSAVGRSRAASNHAAPHRRQHRAPARRAPTRRAVPRPAAMSSPALRFRVSFDCLVTWCSHSACTPSTPARACPNSSSSVSRVPRQSAKHGCPPGGGR